MIDWQFVFESMPVVIGAIPTTLTMVFIAIPIGWILGVLIALVRSSHTPVASQALTVFVSFMRSVPTVVILFVSYYAMPMIMSGYLTSIGLSVDINAVPAIAYATAAFVLDQSAYSSEVFRSAIESVDAGQLEAAQSVGMTKAQAYVRIVLPQAFVTALPNLNGLFVGLIQGTSLAYFVGVYEITATATLQAAASYSYIEAYIMITLVYEVLSYVFNKLFALLEHRVSRFRQLSPTPSAAAA